MNVQWRQHKLWIIGIAVIALLIAIRAVLPIVLIKYVNRTLDQLEGYAGHVNDVDLSLWRGAYQIYGIEITKTEGKVPTPFVEVPTMDLSIEWKALLQGSVVAEIELYSPKLNFVNASNPKHSQAEVDSSWTDTVRDLVPFEINRFAIHDGQVHYRDFESDPRVDIFVQRLEATMRNITNSEDLGGSLYATLEGSALAMGSGKIRFKGGIDPYAPQPTFKLSFLLDKLQLKQLNPFLKAYANVDAEKGTLSLDAELAADSGRFRGYVKPFVRDLQVLKWQEEKEGFFGKLWEGIVQVANDLLENPSRDRVATRIPFSGRVDAPDADIWSTVGGLLKNAFLQGLRRGLEGSVQLGKSSRL